MCFDIILLSIGINKAKRLDKEFQIVSSKISDS